MVTVSKWISWLAHEKRIAQDSRIFDLLKSRLKDSDDIVREQLLYVLDYLLWYEKDEHIKTRFTESFRPIVLDMASHDSNTQVRRNAIHALPKMANQDVLNVLFRMLESDEDAYSGLESSIHSALRSLAESNYRAEIQERLYELLKKTSASARPRIDKIFDELRRR